MESLTVIHTNELTALLRAALREELTSLLPPTSDPFSGYPDLLSRKETANLLGISVATVDNWTREGRLVKHIMGPVVRFKKDEVLSSLETLKTYRR